MGVSCRDQHNTTIDLTFVATITSATTTFVATPSSLVSSRQVSFTDMAGVQLRSLNVTFQRQGTLKIVSSLDTNELVKR